MPDQDLTPLGKLLEHARADVLHLSVREAARRAKISPTRWTQVVTGVAWRAGSQVPIRSTPRTVIAMALAVKVDPGAALQAADMPATAEAVEAVVAELQAPPAAPPIAPDASALVDEIERIRNLRGVSPSDKIRMIKALVDLHEERAATAEEDLKLVD